MNKLQQFAYHISMIILGLGLIGTAMLASAHEHRELVLHQQAECLFDTFN